jgi:hypothetical protein
MPAGALADHLRRPAWRTKAATNAPQHANLQPSDPSSVLLPSQQVSHPLRMPDAQAVCVIDGARWCRTSHGVADETADICCRVPGSTAWERSWQLLKAAVGRGPLTVSWPTGRDRGSAAMSLRPCLDAEDGVGPGSIRSIAARSPHSATSRR